MVEPGIVLQNRYLVQKQIGAGGMGTVYLATDQRLNGAVALKETLFTDPNLLRAFEREAQLLSSLRHPVLPRVMDYFTENEGQFLVMEYFDGEDLSEILKREGAFAVSDVLRWADDLLDALDYLHNQKFPVIHRDIKPQNLKLTPRGEIILLDFGLAKGKTGDTSQLSLTNSVFGYSRSYAPLEQIQGTGTNTRSDIYSLSATLYHLLTGKAPVDALTRATSYVNHQPDPLVPANELNPQIPVAVAEILQKGLELNANLRLESAAAMREALQKAAAGISQTDSVVEDEATKVHAANQRAEQAAFVAAAANAPQFAAPEKIENAKAIEVPISPLTQKSVEDPIAEEPLSYRENKPKSFAKPLGIAAAIIILGGGSLAAWYATSQPTASQSTTNTINVTANQKTTAQEAKSNSTVSPILSNSNSSESKEPETVSKPGTNKTANGEVVNQESSGNSEAQVEPIPIIIKSPPPTKKTNTDESEQTEDDTENKDEDSANAEDDEEAPQPKPRKDDERAPGDEDDAPPPNNKKKNDNRNNPNDNRERPVQNTRKKQKLPTLLGAPQ